MGVGRMSGFVYFIGPEALFRRSPYNDEVKVKIGFTHNCPLQRLKTLQCGSPVTLDLIAYIDGSQDLERAFHDTFAQMRSHGEWFFVEHKLRDFLAYLYPNDWRQPRYADRAKVAVALYDTVFASRSPYPSVSDEIYLRCTDPSHLEGWFPEVCQA